MEAILNNEQVRPGDETMFMHAVFTIQQSTQACRRECSLSDKVLDRCGEGLRHCQVNGGQLPIAYRKRQVSVGGNGK